MKWIFKQVQFLYMALAINTIKRYGFSNGSALWSSAKEDKANVIPDGHLTTAYVTGFAKRGLIRAIINI